VIAIRRDQMAVLSAAAYRRRARGLVDELRAIVPERAEEAEAIVADALRDADAHGFDDPFALERYVKMALELTPEGFQSKWGGMMVRVMTDEARSPKARLNFVERFLLPRMRRAASGEAGSHPSPEEEVDA
jgi:hypothetical protein